MTVKNFRNIIFAFVAMSLSACGAVEHLFVQEVYEAPPTELTEFNMEFDADIIWRAQVGDGAGESAHAMNLWLQQDKLFAVDHEGEVVCFNAANGKKIWDVELDIPVVTGVGGGSDVVYIGSKEGEVIALTSIDGTELWRQKLTSEVLAPATGNSLAVVVRTSDGRVTGLSPTSGDIMWSYQRTVPLLSLRGASMPVIDEDKVIAGYDNGKLVALSLTDGKVIWEKSIAVPRGRTELDRLVDIDADPVVVNDTVYVVTFHGNLAAVEANTGRVRWSRDMSSQTGLAVAYNEAVYVTDDESYIWAVQDLSGDALWRQTRLLRRQASAPEVIGEYVVVGDLEGYLHWMAREDGRFVARTELTDAAIKVKPLVRDGLAYVIAVDGSISAVRVP